MAFVWIHILDRSRLYIASRWAREGRYYLSKFDSQNGAALQELITKHHVKLIKFPDEVLNGLRKLADEVVEEEAAKDPLAKKVAEDFKKFQKIVGTWGTVSEKAYYDIIQKKYPLQV